MNEENKNPLCAGEGENIPNEPTEQIPEKEIESEKLHEELEALKDTFQQQYDQTVKAAEEGIVIQELEEGEDDDDESDEVENSPSFSAEPEKAPKKKRKAGKIIAITIPVVLVTFIIGILSAFVVMTVTNPDFSAFISTYAKAASAEKYDDKVKYLEEALDFCDDKDSQFQLAMKITLLEEIVAATYSEKGYAEAYSYMTENLTEEQTKKSSNALVKKLLKTVKDVNTLSEESFDAIVKNVGDSKEVPAEDVLTAGLNIPADVKETAVEILSSLAEGYIYNKTADSVEDSLVAMNYYANAYSGFVSLGANSESLAQKLCTALYNNGFAIEGASFAAVSIDPEKATLTDEYTAMTQSLKAYSDFKINVIEIAKKAIADEKTSKSDVETVLESAAELDSTQLKVFTSIVLYAIDAINAENEHNLVKASTCYATLSSVFEAFSMADLDIYIKTAQIIFTSGDLATTQTLAQSYFTEEAMKDATAEQKAVVDKMNEAFDALTAASEVFSPFYSEYYQTGAEMDFDEVSDALNELITDESTDIEKGFVNYCLYVTAVSGDSVDPMPYIEAMAQYLPDMPFVYGYYYIEQYLKDKNFTAAKDYAQKLLEVNIADEFANSIVALCSRIDGDLDEAIETALKGMELSGASNYCGKQAAIAYMLKGDFENAFSYLSSAYTNNMSVDSCDMLLIFASLYKGDNEEIKTSLDSLVSEINQTYTYYGVSSYADTKAVLDGTKTLEDVFMGGNYDITDDK